MMISPNMQVQELWSLSPGFANAMVSPALEFKREGLILGVGAKMFSIAGPVILYGSVASVIYGLILAIFG